MTESQVVNEWISKGEVKGQLEERRRNLLKILQRRFPGLIPDEIVQFIGRQENLTMLDDWSDAAIEVSTIEQFMTVLKR